MYCAFLMGSCHIYSSLIVDISFIHFNKNFKNDVFNIRKSDFVCPFMAATPTEYIIRHVFVYARVVPARAKFSRRYQLSKTILCSNSEFTVLFTDFSSSSNILINNIHYNNISLLFYLLSSILNPRSIFTQLEYNISVIRI